LFIETAARACAAATSKTVKHKNFLPALVVFAVLLTGCPQQTAIWISKASTANRTVFGIGKKHGKPGGVSVHVIRVDRCGGKNYPKYDDALWVLSAEGDGEGLKQLVYGETPSGYKVSHGPLPLTSGCYVAGLSGTGSVTFDVDERGLATERK
jgi:hypothetical protein